MPPNKRHGVTFMLPQSAQSGPVRPAPLMYNVHDCPATARRDARARYFNACSLMSLWLHTIITRSFEIFEATMVLSKCSLLFSSFVDKWAYINNLCLVSREK